MCCVPIKPVRSPAVFPKCWMSSRMTSATSLRVASGQKQSRLELLVRLLREFERDYNNFLSEGPTAVLDRFSKVSSYAYGKRVRVSNGRETVTGTTAGIGPEGLLLVKRDNGQVMTVIAGDVSEAL